MQKTRSLSYCIGLVMVVLFVYGLVRYPDLPIRECPSGYCGRQGQPHTAAEYNAFSIWQTTLFIVWPIGMLIMQARKTQKVKRRLKQATQPRQIERDVSRGNTSHRRICCKAQRLRRHVAVVARD